MNAKEQEEWNGLTRDQQEARCLEYVTSRLHAYVDLKWRFYNLHFTDSGALALGSILGFIYGVLQSDRKRASQLAYDFVDRLECLASHNMVPEYPDNPDLKYTVPNSITEVHSDGTFLGLSFAKYSLIGRVLPDDLKADNNKVRKFSSNFYHYNYNGAMIFRSGHFEVDSFKLQPKSNTCYDWSLHS